MTGPGAKSANSRPEGNIVEQSQQTHISPFSNQTNILYDIKSNDIIYNWNWESSHGLRSD